MTNTSQGTSPPVQPAQTWLGSCWYNIDLLTEVHPFFFLLHFLHLLICRIPFLVFSDFSTFFCGSFLHLHTNFSPSHSSSSLPLCLRIFLPFPFSPTLPFSSYSLPSFALPFDVDLKQTCPPPAQRVVVKQRSIHCVRVYVFGDCLSRAVRPCVFQQ